jgi:vitamin B12 transporter
VSLGSYWLVSTNYQYTHNEQLSASLRFSNMFNESYEDVFGYNTNGSRVLLSLAYNW